MVKYALRRLAVIPLALLAINFFGFAYAVFARFVQAGRNPYFAVTGSPEPIFPLYRAYVVDAFQSGFGFMPATRGVTILEAVLEASKNSLGLLAIAFTISLVIGLILGFRAAESDPSSVAWWMAPLSTLGLALPSFYIGALLIAGSIYYIFWVRTGAGLPFPISGFGWDKHLVFPVAALVIRPMVQTARMTSVMLTGEFNKQYVVAARSLGNTWKLIRRHHVLRNVLAPIILGIAGSFRVLVAELILVEWLFGWPGLGRMLALTLIPPEVVSAAAGPHPPEVYLYPPVVATVLTVLTALFLLTDFFSSTLGRIFDPRLNAMEAEVGDV